MEFLMIIALAFFSASSSSNEVEASAASAHEHSGAREEKAAPRRVEPVPTSRPAVVKAEVPLVNPALFKAAAATATAPSQYTVLVKTTKGEFVIKVVRKWSPHGADRFFNLVKLGYFSNVGFFRVIPNFMAQFGIHGNSKVNDAWRHYSIQDDERGPDTQSNLRGMISFAKTAKPDSRGTQLFINFKDNRSLDRMGFTPIGQIVQGMDVVDSIYKTGENPRMLQGQLQARGNKALKAQYPKADYIKSMSLKGKTLR